jgi:hypothetical protein
MVYDGGGLLLQGKPGGAGSRGSCRQAEAAVAASGRNAQGRGACSGGLVS